jgi:ACT domain-containing protein
VSSWRFERELKDRVVVTAIGVNRAGVVAKVSTVLAENGASIEDMSQTIISDLFALIMLVDISSSPTQFKTLKEKLELAGDELGVKILAQHENVFRYMHRV